ncbi:MAG: hypothetical protein HY063_00215 [Bacteroidetes bacterium]|nr:hypothetical protein [Bacteroidota bacterium]
MREAEPKGGANAGECNNKEEINFAYESRRRAGRWSLVAGRWSLVAGRWSLVKRFHRANITDCRQFIARREGKDTIFCKQVFNNKKNPESALNRQSRGFL